MCEAQHYGGTILGMSSDAKKHKKGIREAHEKWKKCGIAKEYVKNTRPAEIRKVRDRTQYVTIPTHCHVLNIVLGLCRFFTPFFIAASPLFAVCKQITVGIWEVVAPDCRLPHNENNLGIYDIKQHLRCRSGWRQPLLLRQPPVAKLSEPSLPNLAVLGQSFGHFASSTVAPFGQDGMRNQPCRFRAHVLDIKALDMPSSLSNPSWNKLVSRTYTSLKQRKHLTSRSSFSWSEGLP